MQLVGSERFGQAFITDTQLGRVEDIFKKTNIEHKIYKLSERGIIDEK